MHIGVLMWCRAGSTGVCCGVASEAVHGHTDRGRLALGMWVWPLQHARRHALMRGHGQHSCSWLWHPTLQSGVVGGKGKQERWHSLMAHRCSVRSGRGKWESRRCPSRCMHQKCGTSGLCQEPLPPSSPTQASEHLVLWGAVGCTVVPHNEQGPGPVLLPGRLHSTQAEVFWWAST